MNAAKLSISRCWISLALAAAGLGVLGEALPSRAGEALPGNIGNPGSPLLTRGASGSLASRAGCSTLCQARQPAAKAFRAIGEAGFKWLDLSALSWCRHVSTPDLVKDFEREASRIESLLASNGLRVANLTFDSFDGQPFAEYEAQFKALAKLAARLKARLINLMAPSNKTERQEAVEKLRKLQAWAAAEGVVLTVETHVGQLTERPADALWLCRQVPGLGLTLDPSHYYAGPNQGAGFDALYPHVQGTGFRAGAMKWEDIQLPWGHGPIDFRVVVGKLEAAGYKGFYVTEYIEGFNAVNALEESRKFLQWCNGR